MLMMSDGDSDYSDTCHSSSSIMTVTNTRSSSNVIIDTKKNQKELTIGNSNNEPSNEPHFENHENIEGSQQMLMSGDMNTSFDESDSSTGKATAALLFMEKHSTNLEKEANNEDKDDIFEYTTHHSNNDYFGIDSEHNINGDDQEYYGDNTKKQEDNHEQQNTIDSHDKYDFDNNNNDDDGNNSDTSCSYTMPVVPTVSILNVMVDYVMSEPTPFEVEEYKWKRLQQEQSQRKKKKQNTGQQQTECSFHLNAAQDDDSYQHDDIHDAHDDDHVQVPIMRIFGPIVRDKGMDINSDMSVDVNTKETQHDNDNDKTNEFHQSGCLHIHGAFPYLLARPVQAGPDGSSFFLDTNSDNDDSNNSLFYHNDNIDWDDEESVSTILDDIHVQLEEALRSSMEQFNQHNAHPNTNSNRNKMATPTNPQILEENSDNSSKPIRFIRKITIVRGRGFYTYCIGTSAPFLRIEYYNPAHRWRVKIMLERGLEMPLCYHPQQQRLSSINCNNRQYGMNSGVNTMDDGHTYKGGNDSDILLLKFRCYEAHIPYTMQFFKDFNLAGMAWINLGDVRFRNPLPRAGKERVFCKQKYEKDNKSSNQNTTSKFNHLLLRGNVPSNLRWSTADESIETDSKNIPLKRSNTTKDDEEFWKCKETSCDVELDTTVTHILNVNNIMTKLPSQSEIEIHWRAVPSLREIWTEERDRMARLLSPKHNFLSADNVDLPFTLSVKKSAPIPGAKSAYHGNKHLFSTDPTLDTNFQRALNDIVKKYDMHFHRLKAKLDDKKAKEKLKSKYYSNKKKKKHQNLSSILSQKDKALCALEGLLNQFSGDFDDDDDVDNGNAILQHPKKSIKMSQLQPTITSLTQADQQEVQDSLKYCLEIEHVDSEKNGEIDPMTLTPFDDLGDKNFLDEEEQMHEEEFEKSLTLMDMQGETHTQEENLSQLDAVINTWSGSQRKSFHEDVALGQDSVSSSGDPVGSLSPTVREHEYYKTPPALERRLSSLLSHESPALQIKGGDTLELTWNPPNKSTFHMTSQLYLYPCHLSKSPIPWLGFSATGRIYQKQQYNFWQASFVEPSTHPPSSSKVRRWVGRRRLKLQKSDEKRSSKLNKVNNDMEFTSNSRKLQRVKSERKVQRKVAFSDEAVLSSSKICIVEEVPWNEGYTQSQESRGTPLSQNSQSDANKESQQNVIRDHTVITQISPFESHSDSINVNDPLLGIGNQGGKIYVEGGGLKASVASSSHFRKQLTIMSVEVHVQCRTGKAGLNSSTQIAMTPDPSRDPISAAFYVYAIDPGNGEQIEIKERGCVFVPTEAELIQARNNRDPNNSIGYTSKVGKTMGISSELKIEVVSNELQLLLRMSSIVQWKDPDALTSWDTQNGGLGYLINRGFALAKNEDDNTKKNTIDMIRLLGRLPKQKRKRNTAQASTDVEAKDSQLFSGSGLGADWDDRVGAGVVASSIVGRLVLNGWKVMSEEVKHPNASYLPAMIATVLKKRIPFHDNLILTKWYSMNKGINRWRVLKHKIVQAISTILLFDALDVIGRAGEAARLSGVEFSQSFPGIRGSQYKVEGVVLRSLQSLVSDRKGDERNYFFFSPSKSDSNKQEALECQAMTLEPKSGFHFDPVVVCDFTALYPSLIIAYNLCYSTIAGKLEYHSTRKEMGRRGSTTQKLGPFDYDEIRTSFLLKQYTSQDKHNSLHDNIYCLPTGSIFLSEDVVQGVLPILLDEILSTRAMLKKAAKIYREQLRPPPSAVLRQLEARQLALKYVANVTYGYTSATFSGRSAMPLLADSIVECGRRTLSNAIALATKWGLDKSSKYYGAEVVYGDTDSIFVKLPGRTVKEAFDFGKDFCNAVTQSNPPPVQLKLEKVYSGTLLQTKKKYCGMKFESPDQTVPSFEAKGIETVRKDQCCLTQKILRNALVTVFRDKGIQRLQTYLFRQWALIHAGRLPVSDFILTGRVRSQYRGKVGPVQAALARRLAEADPGRMVQHKERLPYVIVALPGRNFKLRDGVLTPEELLTQWDAYTIHAFYYVTKHVNAALQRCFGLAPWNLNIQKWYQNCPKPQKRIHHWPMTRMGGNPMISTFFGSDHCAICGQKCKTDGSAKAVICSSCKKDQGSAILVAVRTLNSIQQRSDHLASKCQNCNGCYESSSTFAQEVFTLRTKTKSRLTTNILSPKTLVGRLEPPISTCTCIDCPVTYERHEMRESEIEALALCKALHAFDL